MTSKTIKILGGYTERDVTKQETNQSKTHTKRLKHTATIVTHKGDKF